MNTKFNKNKIVEYWQKTAEHDYETMLVLYKNKRYSDAIFFGHIVLEKILKAQAVWETNEQAPKVHNLVRLAELAGSVLSEVDKDELGLINSFNIRCRYPDYKLDFYNKYNKQAIVKKQLEKIKKLYSKLCLEMKQKRSLESMPKH